ncbi:DUF411 domain-containing protein [Hyphomicrobium sp. CS1GBMeth3]|uniref:DUF411 domain-containing protein n=1 Tax=Hyphomicrobium sp. CS1GBMeth3 TaxID=1892845 RepID=UPI000931D1A7|nr:DUF411 domain-containing protein [Hyphomicrobium sp. CS1GBMeth3]
MENPTRPDRRHVLGWLAAGPALLVSVISVRARAFDETLPPMMVFRDPNCACCHYWVEHLQAHGFTVTVHEAPNMKAVKTRLGVPAELGSCHTGEIGDYVIEGHVPAVAIQRLLAEKPKGRGLAVPGMPIGSPGMEGGTPEVYEVMLFGDGEPRSFGRFREDRPV